MKKSRIELRVSDLEKEQIKKEAQKMQMSVSEYLLYLFRKEPKHQNQNTRILLYAKLTHLCVEHTQNMRRVYALMRRLYAKEFIYEKNIIC